MAKKTKERLAELDKILQDARKLEPEEYLALLREIQKNYVVHLAKNSLQGISRDSAGYIAALEKLHWLIDSTETKGATGPRDGVYHVEFNFRKAKPEVEA